MVNWSELLPVPWDFLKKKKVEQVLALLSGDEWSPRLMSYLRLMSLPVGSHRASPKLNCSICSLLAVLVWLLL